MSLHTNPGISEFAVATNPCCNALTDNHSLCCCNAQFAANSWRWHSIDRALFLKTFKGLPIVKEYTSLRRMAAGLGKKAAAAALAASERQMLLQIMNQYLGQVVGSAMQEEGQSVGESQGEEGAAGKMGY